MEALKFTISGPGAAFKRPYINSINLTYSNIHKISLLGIFGSIIGLKGHRQKSKTEKFPEFYDKLCGLKVSIVPNCRGIFDKSIMTFTETTGFFNKNADMEPATLVTKEQFVVNPSWDVFVMQGSCDDIYSSLKNSLLNNECVYIPYLGKNHFPASISDVSVVELNESTEVENIYSLFPSEDFSIESLDEGFSFYFTEYMPVSLSPTLNHYNELEFCFTNDNIVDFKSSENIYRYFDKNLYFI